MTRESRRVDNDRKSPSYLKVNDDSLNNRDQNDDNFPEQSFTKKSSIGKRRSNRNEKLSTSLRSENNLVNEEKSSRADLKNNNDSTNSRSENLIEKSDNIIENLLNTKLEKKENKDSSNEDSVSANVDSALPRRRAAALAAAVSVAETVNPQRSASPRKRATAGKIINVIKVSVIFFRKFIFT